MITIHLVSSIVSIIIPIQNNLYNKALNNLKSKTYEAKTLGDVKEIMENHPGFVKAPWCGNEECELKMKEIKGTKSRCILEGEHCENEHCVVCGKEAKHMVIWGIQY